MSIHILGELIVIKAIVPFSHYIGTRIRPIEADLRRVRRRTNFMRLGVIPGPSVDQVEIFHTTIPIA